VAIRITRPYTTEDEFLEQELDTLSRTSVTLLGAQPRPQGVVLRFELVLSSGHVLMRGEGRVVGFRPNVHQGMGGLTLRFTRLDTRSKGLVDKAAAFRERRRPSARPDPEPSPAPPPVPDPPPTPPPPLDLEATLAEAPKAKRSEHPPPTAKRSEHPPPAAKRSEHPPPTAKRSEHPPPTALTAPEPPAAPPAPAGREALLERLRSRAKALEPSAVARILEPRRREA
jgi:hypothetical protein